MHGDNGDNSDMLGLPGEPPRWIRAWKTDAAAFLMDSSGHRVCSECKIAGLLLLFIMIIILPLPN